MSAARLAIWVFIALLVLAAPAFAVQGSAKIPRVGIVMTVSKLSDLEMPSNPVSKAVHDGLREHGWADGRNVQLVWRSAEGHYERWPQIIDELLRMPVDILVIADTEAVKIAVGKTRTVPIVAPTAVGLLSEQLVASYARPGGNVTGMAMDPLESALHGKRLAVLKAAAPHVRRVAFLFDADEGFHESYATAARALGLELIPVPFAALEQLDEAIAAAVRRGANGLYVLRGRLTLIADVQKRIHELAVRHRLPAIHHASSAAETGALMVYAHDIFENLRRTGYFVDRILKGARPGDLPIEQPSRTRFVINLQAARAIGLAVPPSVLIQADRVIE